MNFSSISLFFIQFKWITEPVSSRFTPWFLKLNQYSDRYIKKTVKIIIVSFFHLNFTQPFTMIMININSWLLLTMLFKYTHRIYPLKVNTWFRLFTKGDGDWLKVSTESEKKSFIILLFHDRFHGEKKSTNENEYFMMNIMTLGLPEFDIFIHLH